MLKKVINKVLSYSSPSEVQLSLNESPSSAMITSAIAECNLLSGTIVRFPWGIDASPYIKFSESYEYILCKNGTPLPFDLQKGDRILFVTPTVEENVRVSTNIFDSFITFGYGGNSKTKIDFNIKVSYTLHINESLENEFVNRYSSSYLNINSQIRNSVDEAINRYFGDSPVVPLENMSEKQAVDFYNSFFNLKKELEEHILVFLHHQYRYFSFTASECEFVIDDSGKLENYVNEIVKRSREKDLRKLDLENSNELSSINNEYIRREALLDKENEAKLAEYDRDVRKKDAALDLDILKEKLEAETKKEVITKMISGVNQINRSNSKVKEEIIKNNAGTDTEMLLDALKKVDDSTQAAQNELVNHIVNVFNSDKKE